VLRRQAALRLLGTQLQRGSLPANGRLCFRHPCGRLLIALSSQRRHDCGRCASRCKFEPRRSRAAPFRGPEGLAQESVHCEQALQVAGGIRCCMWRPLHTLKAGCACRGIQATPVSTSADEPPHRASGATGVHPGGHHVFAAVSRFTSAHTLHARFALLTPCARRFAHAHSGAQAPGRAAACAC